MTTDEVQSHVYECISAMPTKQAMDAILCISVDYENGCASPAQPQQLPRRPIFHRLERNMRPLSHGLTLQLIARNKYNVPHLGGGAASVALRDEQNVKVATALHALCCAQNRVWMHANR